MVYWSTMASLLGLFAFCQTLLQTLFPPDLRLAILNLFAKIFSSSSSYAFFDITEIDGVNTNELYTAVHLYLSSSVSTSTAGTTTTRRLSLSRPLNSSAVAFGLSNNDSIADEFHGVPVQWQHVVTPRQLHSFSWRIFPEEKRGFTLKIKKREKLFVILNAYLDHIVEKANEIRRKNQDRYLFTNPRGGSLDSRGCNPWEAVPFKHPSTFETIAIDPIKKRQIMEDLRDFAEGKSFYQKSGRAWKRGYLLYGPPGTGKSSLIAAMANFLGYDIYDLELTEVQNNSELRKLLMKTTPKSIIVIEDIDCSIDLSNRKNIAKKSVWEIGGNSITLSGLLNFTDGLWSCCGSERIFVFTTNHMEKLDPALLRSGRMDVHICMSFCSFAALKILLKNYLDFDEEREDLDRGTILSELEECVEEAEMSPADVSEILIKNRREKRRAMREVLEALKLRANKRFAINGVSRNEDHVEEEEAEKIAVENIKDQNGGG